MASYDGYWSNSNDFLFSQASYYFAFGNLSITTDEFRIMMMQLRSGVEDVGKIAKTQNLAINVLIWMNWATISFVGGFVQYFSFMGTPSSVFNANLVVPLFSSTLLDNATCEYMAPASFDIAAATVNIDVVNAEWDGFQTCGTNITNSIFGQTSFSIAVDMNSFTTALAANIGLINTSILETVPAPQVRDQIVDGYYLVEMLDPRYPGMNPIACLFTSLPDDLYLCFVIFSTGGYIYFWLPVLTSFGISDYNEWPFACSW